MYDIPAWLSQSITPTTEVDANLIIFFLKSNKISGVDEIKPID